MKKNYIISFILGLIFLVTIANTTGMAAENHNYKGTSIAASHHMEGYDVEQETITELPSLFGLPECSHLDYFTWTEHTQISWNSTSHVTNIVRQYKCTFCGRTSSLNMTDNQRVNHTFTYLDMGHNSTNKTHTYRPYCSYCSYTKADITITCSGNPHITPRNINVIGTNK